MKKRIISLLLTLALLLGMMPAVANTATAAGNAAIVSAKLVLGNVLSVNFNVDLKGGAAEDYSVTVKIGDETVERAAEPVAQPDASGQQVYTLKLAAHTMHETLHVSLKKGDTVLQSKDWTVKRYIDQLHNNRSDDKLMIDLADALSNYGEYAAYYTGKTNTDPAIADVTAVDAAALDGFKPQSIVAFDNTEKIRDDVFALTGEAVTEGIPEGYKTVTKLTTSWNKYNFNSVDLTPYQEVRFAVKSSGWFGLMYDGKVFAETSSKDGYLLIELIKTANGWNVFYDGVQKTSDNDGNAITIGVISNLDELNFRFGSNDYYVTELIGVTASLSPTTYLYVDDACDLAFRFNAEAMNGKQLFIDGQAVETTAVSGGKVEYRCKDILPQHWGESIHVAVKNGETVVYEMNYSILSYARQVIKLEADSYAKLQGLMKAMYLYSAAAKCYSDGGEVISLADVPFALTGTASEEAAPAGYETVTKLTTSWNAYNFVDMSDYINVSFAVKSTAYYGVMYNGAVINETTNNGNWLEISLEKADGGWNLYYGGKLQQLLEISSLNDLNFRFGAGHYYVTELRGIVPQFINIADHPFAITGEASTETIPESYNTVATLATSWNKYDFFGMDLSPYSQIRFQVKSAGYYGVMTDASTVVNETNGGGNWLEIKLKKTDSGWDLYYGGVKQQTVSLPNNRLSDLNFRFGSNTYHVTNLQGVKDPTYEDAYVLVHHNPLSLSGTATTGVYGKNKFFTILSNSWNQYNFIDLELDGYKALKFAVQSTAGVGVMSDGSVIGTEATPKNWYEIELKKSSEGWDVYYDGVKQTATPLAISNLNQLNFRLGTATTTITALMGIRDSGYVNPWVNVVDNLINSSPTSVSGRDVPSCDVDTVNIINCGWISPGLVDGITMADWTELKLYYKVSDAGKWFEMFDASNSALYQGNATEWTEVRFTLEGEVWTLYVGGEWKKSNLTGTTLKDIVAKLTLGGSVTADVYVTNLVGIPYVNEYVNVADNALVRVPDATDTALPSRDVSGVNVYSGGWSATTLTEGVELAKYTELKFYTKTSDENKWFEMYYADDKQAFATSSAAWVEFKLVLEGQVWTLYKDGVWTESNLTGTYLSDIFPKIQLGGSATAADVYVTNLLGKENPNYVYVSPYVNVADNMVNKTPTSTTTEDLPSEDVSRVNIINCGWASPGVVDGIKLAKYTELKFWYKVSDAGKWFEMFDASGDAMYQGNATDWTEVKLLPEANGSWTLYINGEGKKWGLTGTTLKEMIPTLTLGGTVTADVYVTNLIGKEDPNYEEPLEPGEPENPITLNLVQDGQVNYKLVSGNNGPDYSAVEGHLKKYLEEATGKTWGHSQIQWVNDSTNSILVGAELALEFGITNQKALDEMGASDYRITTKDSQIFIYGGSNQGTVNGIYAFLGKQLGLKIYAQGVYNIDTVTNLSFTSYTELGNLNYDYLFSGYGEIRSDGLIGDDDDKHGNAMGFVTDYAIMVGDPHGATTMISYDTYNSTNPGWFYSVPYMDENGTILGYHRQLYMAHGNFATGEGSLLATVADKMWEMISSNTDKEKFTFGPADIDIWPTGTGYEYSDSLKTTYGSNSAEYIIFMNELAKLIEAKIAASSAPDREIQLVFLAYNKTLVAPELDGLTAEQIDKVKLYQGDSVQIVPYVAPVESNYHMTFDNVSNKVKNPTTGKIDDGSLTVAQMLSGWQTLVDKSNAEEMLFWWYSLDANDYFMVVNTYDNMGYNYYLAKKYGVTSILHQAQYDNEVATDWGRMKIYLQAALARHDHAAMDTPEKGKAVVQQYINEFMEAYFGPAAEQMKNLMDAQRTWYATVLAISATDTNNPYWLGKLRGSAYTTDYPWRWTEDGGVKVGTWDKWTKNTEMVDSWWAYITAAKTAINNSGLSDTEKAELTKRVEIEGLVIRNIYIKAFEKKDIDTSVANFHADAAALGITHSAEGTPIN